MTSYTVKQIADMLSTSEETVRRWIRSGKLDATLISKKSGNVISSAALNKFINTTPKYTSVVTSALVTSPIAMSVVVGGILGGILGLMEGKKKETISFVDVDEFLKKKIALHEKALDTKKAALAKMQADIEFEQQELEKYKYALEKLDLKVLATEINNAKKYGGKV